jgi:hypothetical protein
LVDLNAFGFRSRNPANMSADSITQIVQNIQSVYTIILALAIAEGFNQAVRTRDPEEEKHASTLRSWFDCVHASRFVSLLVFLLLAVPFFQGNHKFLYSQYIAPLHGVNPPKVISARWLNFDCLVFSVEAGIFFVMSRSLSARRWQQFYATIIVLMLLDFVWAALEKWHGAAVPNEWLWFDAIAALVLAAIIAVDWFFVRYERGKNLNVACYATISVVALAGLIYGYLKELDYLVEN